MHIGIVCKYELLRICSGHRCQNMWLLKADARTMTIKRTSLQIQVQLNTFYTYTL